MKEQNAVLPIPFLSIVVQARKVFIEQARKAF